MLRGFVLLVLLSFAAPVQAAQFLITGTASGTIDRNIGCPSCETVTPVTRSFSVLLDPVNPPEFGGYTEYSPGKFGFITLGGSLMTTYISGTFEQTDTGYVGTNLYAYDEGHSCYPAACTTLSASSFSVVALDPSAVPEPATWALLMVGLFVVGWATRRPLTAGLQAYR